MSRGGLDRGEVLRYVVNGVAATAAHYAVLALCIEALYATSAGLANAAGAMVGISVSFVGSRQWVYRGHRESWGTQAGRFGMLYICIAVLHASVLFLWSDLGGLDYRIGFVFATLLQMTLSYWGNKRLVFPSAAKAESDAGGF